MLVNRFVRYSRQGAIRLAVLALVPVSAHAGGGPPPLPLQNVSVEVHKHATLLSSTAVSVEISIKCPEGTDLTENQLTVSQASGAAGFASIRAIACDGKSHKYQVVAEEGTGKPGFTQPAFTQGSAAVILDLTGTQSGELRFSRFQSPIDIDD
jgi:hypothetical protein